MIFADGSPFERGFRHGFSTTGEIRHNLNCFWRLASPFISHDQAMDRFSGKTTKMLFDDDTIEYMKGIASGSNLNLGDIIALNALRHLVAPEECSVLIAMGGWTITGSPIVLKNSDKIGSEKFTGDDFYGFKEINVVILEKPDNGHKFAAISAAGETAVKMGMNDRGVVAAGNIARTLDLRQKNPDVTKIRALDRGSLLRKGLGFAGSSREASKLVTDELLEHAMSTPGNIEFVDRESAFLIEGSYDRMSVMQLSEGAAVRVNKFELMHQLNDPNNISSHARFIRATELLSNNKGTVSAESMIQFSKDHANGPGNNSICRHDRDFHSETTLSSAVMEINPSDPKRSRFHFCLGKPCVAWSEQECHHVIDMTSELQDLPQMQRNGESWKRHYTEEPRI